MSAAPPRALLPVPMMNIINGGVHADNPIDFQEFMIMPVGAPTFAEALRAGAEIFHTLQAAAQSRPATTPMSATRAALRRTCRRRKPRSISSCRRSRRPATSRAATSCSRSICAATEFFKNGAYVYEGEGKTRSPQQQVDYLARAGRDAIRSSRSRTAWRRTTGTAGRLLTDTIGAKCQLVGDDLFVTNVTRLAKGIKDGIANSILIKVNQIGTLTETLAAVEMAHKAGYTAVMSHRSGETEDSTIADLAVATNCGQIKTGSLARSDRIAKYNQLLRIEEELGAQAKYAGRSALKARR